MGRRQKTWARVALRRLAVSLGGRCVACGSAEDLEFDCRTPLGRQHHGMDSSARCCFYRAQARKGNLQLLCAPCNTLKGRMNLADWNTLLTEIRKEVTYTIRSKGGEQDQQLQNLIQRIHLEKPWL